MIPREELRAYELQSWYLFISVIQSVFTFFVCGVSLIVLLVYVVALYLYRLTGKLEGTVAAWEPKIPPMFDTERNDNV